MLLRQGDGHIQLCELLYPINNTDLDDHLGEVWRQVSYGQQQTEPDIVEIQALII